MKIQQNKDCYIYKIITCYKRLKLLGIPLPFKKRIDFYICYYYYSIQVLDENGVMLEEYQYEEFKDILNPFIKKAKNLLHIRN